MSNHEPNLFLSSVNEMWQLLLSVPSFFKVVYINSHLLFLTQDNRTVSAAHFHEQVAFYGEQVIINLVNQKKYEGKLEEKFKGLVNNLNQVQISQGFVRDDNWIKEFYDFTTLLFGFEIITSIH